MGLRRISPRWIPQKLRNSRRNSTTLRKRSSTRDSSTSSTLYLPLSEKKNRSDHYLSLSVFLSPFLPRCGSDARSPAQPRWLSLHPILGCVEDRNGFSFSTV